MKNHIHTPGICHTPKRSLTSQLGASFDTPIDWASRITGMKLASDKNIQEGLARVVILIFFLAATAQFR